MSQDALRRLAVYGTLRPGQSNHHQVSMLRGEWTTGSVRGQLHAKGWGAAQGFPGLVLKGESEVHVDVLHSEDLPHHWERLDVFEGEGYRRTSVMVRTESGEVEAFIYVLADP